MLDGVDIERAIAAAKAELERREQARSRLLPFAQFTKEDYRVGPPHRLIAAKLDAVMRGEINRLMIWAPPRHGKSELATRRFPAFYLGSRPDHQIIVSSASADLARDFGRDVRNIISSPEYGALFPGIGLAADSRAANRWNTSKEGIYVSASIGSSIVGRGANCLVGSTVLQTLSGPQRIADIAISDEPVYALAYDETEHRPVFAPVVAGARRSTDITYRITCSSGEVVTATGNHRFRRGDCWVPAQALGVGDILLRVVQKGCEHLPARSSEESEGGALDVLLQPGMRKPQRKREAVRGWTENLPEMRKGASAQIESVLLGRVPGSSTPEETAGACKQDTGATLRGVLQDLPSCVDDREVAILLREMPWGMAVGSHDARTKPRLAEGNSAGTVCEYAAPALQTRTSMDHSGGWWVRRLPQQEETGDTPYRHGCHKQLSDESRNALQTMPCGIPCGGTFETEEVTVAVVERVCEESWVYDVQIGKHENFFANGVLVHNCLLIDDPFKDREDAASLGRRESVWSWYTSVARPRLMKGGAVVIINTRWHPDDLCGRLLKAAEEGDGEPWEVVSIPAICEDSLHDPLHRKLGEAAWPNEYGIPELEAIRLAVGEVEWQAQYQQNPTPPKGTLFDVSKLVTVPDVPEGAIRWVRAWDLAASAQVGGRDPDWTVGVKLGLIPGSRRIIIADVKRIRKEPMFVENLIVQTAKEDGPGTRIRLPQDPGAAGKSYAQVLARLLLGYDVVIQPVTGSKQTRATGLSAQINAGNVMMLAGSWNDVFKLELAAFPSSKHDDQVDAASDAFNAVAVAPNVSRRIRLNIMGR